MDRYNIEEKKHTASPLDTDDFHNVTLPTYCANNPMQEKFHAQLFAQNKDTVEFSNKTKCCCIQRPSWWYHTYPDGTQEIRWTAVAISIIVLLMLIFFICLLFFFIQNTYEVIEEHSTVKTSLVNNNTNTV